MKTADWNGKKPVFSIHFTSYQRRESAEKDSRRLEKLGLPVNIVTIEIVGKGTWYRVMLGEFETSSEAVAAWRRFKEASTPDMGQVYRLLPLP